MTGSGKSGDVKRAERLKAALRENLRRRKAQQRQRAAGKAGARPDDAKRKDD